MGNRVDIYFFNKETGEREKLKECVLKKSFIYKRCDFILVEKHHYFFVCYSDEKKDLYNIWSRYDIIDDELVSDNQVLSYFRKSFDKNNITKDLIIKFLKKPLKTSLILNFDDRKRLPRATEK